MTGLSIRYWQKRALTGEVPGGSLVEDAIAARDPFCPGIELSGRARFGCGDFVGESLERLAKAEADVMAGRLDEVTV